MERWSEERINAYKRYIKNEEDEIRKWERSLQHHEEGVQRARKMIELYRMSKVRTITQLKENGYDLS